MGIPHQNLLVVIGKAKDEAKSILIALEQQGHPQTGESSGLYLALVSIHKRLSAPDAPASLTPFVGELEQMARLCAGKLAAIQPMIQEALRIARGG